jgi:hypothetical protein
MNDRIQELVISSGIYDCILDPYDKLNNGDPSSSVMFDMEKFAELIVKECVNVCVSMQLIGPYKEVQDATLKDAVAQIKDHFGVEG